MDAQSKISQQRYEFFYDRLVRKTQASMPHDLAFIFKAPLTATNGSDSSCLATGTYNILIGRTFGLFPVINLQLHIITTEKKQIPNTVSINQVPDAPPILTSTPWRTRVRPARNHKLTPTRIYPHPRLTDVLFSNN